MARHALTPRLSLAEKIGYGLGDAACNVVFQMVMTFMAYFYTDVFGLAPAAMGTLLLVVRAITSLADPVAGFLCDRTETRWGKFRPYLLWMSVPYAAIAVLAFTTPGFSPGAKLVYAYVTYSLLMAVYSAINVPYSALGAVMTSDTHERVSLNGFRFFLATAGGALAVASTLPLVDFLGQGDKQTGFQLAVAALMAVAVAMFLACFLMTKERVAQVSSKAASLWADVKYLFMNDQWRVVAALNFVLFVALVIQDGSTMYYVTWYVGRPGLAGAFVTTGMISSMFGALCAGPLAAKTPKATAYSILQALAVALLVALYLVPEDQVLLLFVLYAVQQFFTQMASPILWAMMADTADYGEFVTGRRITGLVFSGALFSLKLGTAAGGALLGWLLAVAGYHSKAASQSPAAIQGILILFTLCPAIGHTTLIALTSLYRLDDDRCEEIRNELNRRRESSTGLIDAATP